MAKTLESVAMELWKQGKIIDPKNGSPVKLKEGPEGKHVPHYAITKFALLNVVNGKKLKTDLSFYSYATVFNRMVPYMTVMNDVDLFNSSENEDGSPAGIVHYGLKPMKFDDWIERYATTQRKEISGIIPLYEQYKK